VTDEGGGVDTAVATDTGGGTNACFECLKPGLSLRFTTLSVKEPSVPEGLPAFLNGIWAPDMCDYRLNILLQIEKVTENTDGTLALDLVAGSAWHERTMEQVLPINEPPDCGTPPSAFWFVEGSTSKFKATVDAQCNFATVGAADIGFHPGTIDHGLICSGGDDTIGLKVDTIPIVNLVASGKFSGDCKQIAGGDMSGCIAAEAACQICNFMTAPDYSTYKREPQAVAGEKCQSSYCKEHCADFGWVNFGRFVEDLGVPKGCDIDKDGTADAYLIGGSWTADSVGMKP
jgi:hypothetical protein